MWSNEPPSLPDWVERGHQILSAEIADASSEGLPRDRAREELLTIADAVVGGRSVDLG